MIGKNIHVERNEIWVPLKRHLERYGIVFTPEELETVPDLVQADNGEYVYGWKEIKKPKIMWDMITNPEWYEGREPASMMPERGYFKVSSSSRHYISLIIRLFVDGHYNWVDDEAKIIGGDLICPSRIPTLMKRYTEIANKLGDDHNDDISGVLGL